MLASDKDGGLEALKFSLASDIVELVVLTADEAFLQTLRDAVGGSRRLWHVPSSDKVSDLLVAGQVGILVLDVQALHETAAVFVSQIKRQFPDLVVVVAGNRDAETLLAGLISLGLVYRFIHKPMSPARAKLFADAAVKRYDEQRRRVSTAPTKTATAPVTHRWLIGTGFGVLATSMAAVWFLQHAWREGGTASHAEITTATAVESPLLTRAAAALAANRLTPPAPDNALELYLQLLARNPADRVARAGLTEVHERLLARAENALLEERLDEAAAAIEAARKAGVESGRIAFLTAQLGRSRSLVKTPVPAAAPGANGDAPAAGGLAESLSLAAERLQEGRLLDPEQDSARYYVQRALRIAPNSDAAAAAEQSLAMALVTETHSAINRRDFTRAAGLLDAAHGIASPTNVDNLEQLLRAARQQAQSETSDPLVNTASADATGVAQTVLPDVVGAEQLTMVKSVHPVYPPKAAASGIEGWVELDFTVSEKGAVQDIAVHSATPPGVFDSAAISALAQWRFRPVEHNSKPAAQRARLRIRFTLGA